MPLQNLNEQVKYLIDELQLDLTVMEQIKFSSSFKDSFIRLSGLEIEFFDYYAKTKKAGSGKIVLPSFTWFFIAAKLQPLYELLMRYKEIVYEGYLSGLPAGKPSFSIWIEGLKPGNTAIDTTFQTYIQNHYALKPNEVGYITSFLTNYPWWSGQKTIDRDDFFYSPMLNTANLIADSSTYINDLVSIMDKHPTLRIQLIELERQQRNYIFKTLHLKKFAFELFKLLFETEAEKLESLLILGQQFQLAGDNYTSVDLPHLTNVFNLFQTSPAPDPSISDLIRTNGQNFLYVNSRWTGPGQQSALSYELLSTFLSKYFPNYIIKYKDIAGLGFVYFLSFREPFNKIVYGAPGTGKSYFIKEQVKNHGSIRVTFNPEYSYGQFVGTYKPVSNPNISYNLVPGPLLNALEKANLVYPEPFFLIIEELNRANVSAVFGDTFQLLDRDDTGWSEYGITFNTDIMSHLVSKQIVAVNDEVKLPSNLYIYASMNSADQGVFPLDTAFKRRWNMEYIGINDGETAISMFDLFINKIVKINWNSFRAHLNIYLQNKGGIQEDKLIGPFFLNKIDLSSKYGFAGKLVLYLWDDVLRHKKRNILFIPETLSEINGVINRNLTVQTLLTNLFVPDFLANAPFMPHP